MAAIGNKILDLDHFDSGIAFLLATPPIQNIDFSYKNCNLHACPKNPYIIFQFSGATSENESYNQGSCLLQSALDLLSITGKGDLLTRDTDDEYIVWWKSDNKITLSFITTCSFKFTIGSPILHATDAKGNIIPPTPPNTQYHLGFRFFRLSQTSNDLYDAYRNMYLSFESLLSSKYPKTQQKEINWLKDSLSKASTNLSLSNLISVKSDAISEIISLIYYDARLPLFHAKDGKAYFTPISNTANREAVVKSLKVLTQLVLRMAKEWYLAPRQGGWVNLELFAEQNKSLYANTHFVFTDNPNFTLSDDINSLSVTKGISFPARFSEEHNGDQRQNITGVIHTSSMSNRWDFKASYLVNPDSPLIAISPDTEVKLDGFDFFQIRIFIRMQNSSTPKYIYSR